MTRDMERVIAEGPGWQMVRRASDLSIFVRCDSLEVAEAVKRVLLRGLMPSPERAVVTAPYTPEEREAVERDLAAFSRTGNLYYVQQIRVADAARRYLALTAPRPPCQCAGSEPCDCGTPDARLRWFIPELLARLPEARHPLSARPPELFILEALDERLVRNASDTPAEGPGEKGER